MKSHLWCKNNSSLNVPYGYPNGLSCVGCYDGTLSNTHAKVDPYPAELNDRFVDHRNDLLHEFINRAIVSLFARDFDRGLLQLVGYDIV